MGKIVMTEKQLAQLEAFCQDELKRHIRSNQQKGIVDDLIDVKIVTDSLSKNLGIMEEINAMLYAPKCPQKESLKAIKFFSMVKRVMMRSSGPERRLNLRIFTELLRELRIKLDITKAGLSPEKIKSIIEARIDDKTDIGENHSVMKRRIERIVLSEFNTIHIAKVQGAILKA